MVLPEKSFKERMRSPIRAIQGNFDHLMGQLRMLASAHNKLDQIVEDLSSTVDNDQQLIGDHNHDGTDTETVSHDDLTGVSANDHHNEAHTILSTAHSDSDSTDTPANDEVLTWNTALAKWVADAVPESVRSGGMGKRRGPLGDTIMPDHDHFEWAVPGPPGPRGAPGSDTAVMLPHEHDEDPFIWPAAAAAAAASGTLADHTHSIAGDGGADLYPSGVTEIDGSLSLFNWINDSPVGNQNNYHAAGFDVAVGVTANPVANINVTGLDLTGSGGPFTEGHVFGVRLSAGNTFSLTLKHESASSSAANRFFFSDAADMTITDGATIFLIYHLGKQRWTLWGVKGSAGAAGAAGATGATGPAVWLPDPPADDDPFVWPAAAAGAAAAAAGSALQVRVVTSPSTISLGDQTPDLYITASSDGTITWAAISGVAATAGAKATFKKNGTDMWAGSTKPEVPGGGGVSAERAPDSGSFHLAAADILTLNLTVSTVGPVNVMYGFTPD